MILFTGKEQRHRHRKWTCGHSDGGKGGWEELRDQDRHTPLYVYI